MPRAKGDAFIAALREAITGGGLVLRYQPRIGLGEPGFTGVEALVRWHRPDSGLVFPDRLLPAAEYAGLSAELAEWVLAAALRDMRTLDRVQPGISMAINISGAAVYDRSLAERVSSVLEQVAIPAERLQFEVPESVLCVEPEAAGEALRGLTTLGARITVDDFGHGYTAVDYVRGLSASELKCEASLVAAVADGGPEAAIVRAVIDLAHDLGMQAGASGVESAHNLALLAEMGCDVVQGYHLLPPMPLPAVCDWLGSNVSERVPPRP